MMNCSLLVLTLLTVFAECHEYLQVIRLCLYVSTMVPSVHLHYAERFGFLVPLTNATNSRSFIRYCDMDEPTYCQDPFMNRIVAIVSYNKFTELPKQRTRFGNGEVITIGVLVNAYTVVSSFNPFRGLVNSFPRYFMNVYHYRAKWFVKGTFHGYLIETLHVFCARQVAGDIKFTLPPEQYHGEDRQHSPLHDLIVFGTSGIDLTWDRTWYIPAGSNEVITNFEPEVTVLAKPGQRLSDKLKFVSLGFIDDDHITNGNHLLTVELERQDRVMVNCDEWFVRDWGYFICIRNVGDYVGIGSGAFLFSNNTLFGVGSFALKKDNESILAFTDVRPYHSEINRTCYPRNRYIG